MKAQPSTMRERRLLTIGHSYVVAENRRLADEMARQGEGRWRVTAIAPRSYRGDLRPIALEPLPEEACELRPARMRFSASPHLMWYGGVTDVLRQPWDAVHCWEEPYVHAADRIARAIRPDARFVVSTFQNLAKTYPWPLSRFEQHVMTRANGWIAFGTTVRDALSPRTGYRETPMRIIPPGVDVDVFAPSADAGRALRRQLGWSDTDFVVGYLGRFVEPKGIRVLTSALSAVDDPWRALFVGGGPLQAELQAFAQRFPGRVHIESGVPHGDVPRWLNAMSILCAPSLSTAAWREQFGRMLIEAMACGVPVAASDSGEMPYVVGGAGVITPEGDAGALASALSSLRDDPARRCALAAAARARVEACYSWARVARAHLDFFESLS